MTTVELSRCLSPLEIPQQEDTGLNLSTFPPQISAPSMLLAHQHQNTTSEPNAELHRRERPRNADQTTPIPRHASSSISLPLAYPTPVLHPLLALASGSEVVYRPFPPALPKHQGMPAVIVPGDTPTHLFFVRLSHVPGDYKMLAFPTGASFTSVNDVLHAVRAAVAGASTEPKPEELGEVKEGRVRLDSMGRCTISHIVVFANRSDISRDGGERNACEHVCTRNQDEEVEDDALPPVMPLRRAVDDNDRECFELAKRCNFIGVEKLKKRRRWDCVCYSMCATPDVDRSHLIHKWLKRLGKHAVCWTQTELKRKPRTTLKCNNTFRLLEVGQNEFLVLDFMLSNKI
ncbi:hypothetical protein BDQ12DRAFT_665570 [Crucibulum laeve]|uniref:Uncharacterized protein n=1 Tax=Crucibulum laeve TaxID=68775 RepID=A0A5C3M3T2_9AGAR|nr:hypothetical protein BDQ12DRAFT_665570 [Crucibulum laeve]